jgi:hypothetical protein
LLRRLHAGGDYSVNLALSVLCKALEGLHYAHSLSDFSGRPLKIIHRDVSPHNIFVTYDGQVKLLDFGIAKLEMSNGQTLTGVIKGKLAYMPREQIEGSEVDCRADIFALGVILWEVVAGQRMWGTLSEATLMKNLLCNDIPHLRRAKPDVDPDLEQIVNKAVAPEAGDRYGSAHELLVALTGYLEAHGGVSSQAVIADLISRTCGDLKEQARKNLDRELAKFSQSADGSWDEVPAEFSGSGPKAEFSGSGPKAEPAAVPLEVRQHGDNVTRTGFAGQSKTSLPPAKPRRWPPLLGAGAVALAALGAWLALASGGAHDPMELGQPAATPAAVAMVRLVLGAAPPQAALYLDGAQLASNPFTISLPADQREHELRVTAEGFLPLTRALRFDADADIQLALAPAPPAEKEAAQSSTSTTAAAAPGGSPHVKAATRAGSRSRAAARGLSAAPKTGPAAGKSGQPDDACNPPYVVNELGVKRYKRECLK